MAVVIHRFGEIRSTQDEARRLVDTGEAEPGHVIVADRQTDGRGRFGRVWLSPQGGLYATYIIAGQPSLAWIASVASARALGRFGVDATLKWPNDLLVNDAKLAGILIEKIGKLALIGIGINLVDAPLETATSVRIVGGTVQRGELVVAICEEICAAEHSDDLQTAYRERLGTLGQSVRVIPEEEGPEINGTAVDIDAEGRLLVETNRGVHAISTGECVHLRTQTNDKRSDHGTD